MANRVNQAKIFAVVQFGGCSGEYYMHTFSKRRLALEYMNDAVRASYDSIGPFEVLLAAEGALVRSAQKMLAWLQNRGYGNEKVSLNLEKAITEVRNVLGLS